MFRIHSRRTCLLSLILELSVDLKPHSNRDMHGVMQYRGERQGGRHDDVYTLRALASLLLACLVVHRDRRVVCCMCGCA